MAKNPLILKVDPHAWHLLRWLSVYPFVFTTIMTYGALAWMSLEGRPVDLSDTTNIKLALIVGVGGFVVWCARVGLQFVKLVIMLAIAYVVASYLSWFEKRKAATDLVKINRMPRQGE